MVGESGAFNAGDINMKIVKIIIAAAFLFTFMAASSEAAWLIYHKPEFKGKVIDAETKEPIEGTVVVAVYYKATMGLGAGSISSIINTREVLTDKDGIFRIPSYTTIILPFSWSASASFIIFKPGYGTFPLMQVYPPSLSLPDQEIFFSAGVGAERWLNAYVADWKYEYKTLKTGIVELPKVKTLEQRRKALMDVDVYGPHIKPKELPLFYKMIEEERRSGF
jgi:hypothetical protein